MNAQILKNVFIKSSAFAVLAFLYFPLIIIILYSFNAENVNATFPSANSTEI